MKTKPIYKTLHPEVNVIDAAAGIVEYIASDQSIDSGGDILMLSGWRFNRFRKNAPFLNSHQSKDIQDLLGKVLSADIQDGQLVERVQWAIDVPDNDLARLGFQMTEAGYLKAVSVGFLPLEQVTSKDSIWPQAVRSLGFDDEIAKNAQRIFIKQEQTELSSVVVGCNPNALAKAFEDGAVNDEMMHKIGFGSDEALDFLTKAAVAVDHPEADEVFKSIVGLEMGRIYAARPATQTKSFQNEPKPQPDTQAKKLAAASEVQRRDEGRSTFLNQLAHLTK